MANCIPEQSQQSTNEINNISEQYYQYTTIMLSIHNKEPWSEITIHAQAIKTTNKTKQGKLHPSEITTIRKGN